MRRKVYRERNVLGEGPIERWGDFSRGRERGRPFRRGRERRRAEGMRGEG